jgi:hypothetical protein
MNWWDQIDDEVKSAVFAISVLGVNLTMAILSVAIPLATYNIHRLNLCAQLPPEQAVLCLN